MEFNQQQEAALESIARWLETDEQVFYLAGYAGTGKTTLAKEFDATFFAAFTGKAAHVLKEKGCKNPRTIHSLIYRPSIQSANHLKELIATLEELEASADDKRTEIERQHALIRDEEEALKRPYWALNTESDLVSAKLLVIDECSMVDQSMGEDLLSFGCKVLVLGDPAQLPPVFGQGFFTGREPDALLTEIHRQAKGNPILDLATYVRTHGSMPSNSPLRIGKPKKEDAIGVDQIIVGRNKTRRAVNKRIREFLGFESALPEPGDRVVCLRNDHEMGIMNGQVFEVTEIFDASDSTIFLNLDGELMVEAHHAPFLGVDLPMWSKLEAQEFDFGYALTCHKAQGSQWQSVGLFDQSHMFGQDRARWLYTAITRAAERLWIT